VLDVSGRTDGTLSLGNARTLSGHGTVRGALIANAGSTVSPGGASSAGLLGVTGAVTLAAGSTTIMEVDKANFTNDTISAASVAYNGTLQVVNLGTPYGAGNTFKLFSAGSYSGAFTIVPATPGPGFVWDITGLATNGTLKVRSTTPVTPPQIVTFGSSGTDVTLGGSGGPAYGSYDVLTTTNLGLPASSWTVLGSNYFDASGNFSITMPINSNEAYRFFVLRLP